MNKAWTVNLPAATMQILPTADYTPARQEPSSYHRFRTRLVALCYAVAATSLLLSGEAYKNATDQWTLLVLGAWAAALVAYPAPASRLLWLQAVLISFLWTDFLWAALLMVGHCIWLGRSPRRWVEGLVQYTTAGIVLLLVVNNGWWQGHWWATLAALWLPYPFLYKLLIRRLEPK